MTPESQVRFRTQGEAGPVAFLSPDECAQRAMLSRKVIYRAIEGGELLAFRVRARLRIPEEEFQPMDDRGSGVSRAANTP